MDLEYNGKVVGVTGAGSPGGIGFAVAKYLATQGARVFLCDLNPEVLEAACAQLAPLGEVKACPCDVSDPRQVEALFAWVRREYGRLDVMINNAGIYPQSAICEMTADEWDRVMGVNLRSVFLCCKEAAAVMRGQESGGVLLNAASFAALIPSAGSGAYAASKAAVYSLTKTLAAELAPFGIRVNGFIPGVIETGMTKAVVDARRSQLEDQIALHRLGKPEDVAKAVAFLGSPAAAYITGTFIEISGGKLCVQNPAYGWQ